jgi:hypothetical protein
VGQRREALAYTVHASMPSTQIPYCIVSSSAKISVSGTHHGTGIYCSRLKATNQSPSSTLHTLHSTPHSTHIRTPSPTSYGRPLVDPFNLSFLPLLYCTEYFSALHGEKYSMYSVLYLTLFSLLFFFPFLPPPPPRGPT